MSMSRGLQGTGATVALTAHSMTQQREVLPATQPLSRINSAELEWGAPARCDLMQGEVVEQRHAFAQPGMLSGSHIEDTLM